MITKFTKITGEEGINVAEMTNKSKGNVAITVLDLDTRPSEAAIEKLGAIEGVFRVRVIK